MIRKEILLLLCFTCYGIFVNAQMEYNEKEIIEYACHKLATDSIEPSETGLQKFVEEVFSAFKVEEDKKLQLLLRLQHGCPLFIKLNVLTYGIHQDWKMYDEKPKSMLKKSLIRKFRREKELYYFDTDGGVTKVEFKGNIWYEHLPDRAYSQLEFHRVSKNRFCIEFQESNHWMKKHFSKVGEKVNYEILDYKDGKYLLCLLVPGNELYFTFHAYTDRSRMHDLEF